MTVQEHAATKKLPPEAIAKDDILRAAAPRYPIIVSRDIKVTIPPASRKAGMRQVRTWRAIYSLKASIPPSKTSI
jgi:hypothetical protein